MELQFDATTVNPQGDRTPVPDGEYPVILTSTEIKHSNQTDSMINCGMKITEGPLSGKMIFTNINYRNGNPVAQQIGQERLSALCHVCGVLKITDTAQLHGRPFKAKCTINERDKRYNEVTFLKSDGTAPVGTASAPGAGGPGGPPPAWAGAAAPTPPPGQAPPPGQPAQPPQQPPAAAQKMYYVAYNGQTNPTPMSADAVRALPMGLGAIQVVEVGTQNWQPGTVLQAQSAPLTPTTAASPGLPPWMQQPPPTQ